MIAYPSPRLALCALCVAAFAAAGYLWPPAFELAVWLAWALGLAAAVDLLLTAGALKGKVMLRREFPHNITVAVPRRGSHTIERLPSARGPNSIRPWNHPTILPSLMARAIVSSKASSSG